MTTEASDRDREQPLAADIDPDDATPAEGPGHQGEPGSEPDEDRVVEEKGQGEGTVADG